MYKYFPGTLYILLFVDVWLKTVDYLNWILEQTRMLVNMRSHMMFRPKIIYIFDLIVNLIMR